MVYYVTWGDFRIASSRLRVYNIQPYIENTYLGTPEDMNLYENSDIKYTKNDVLIIQKKPDIEELRNAKIHGATVIYDIDDLYWDKPEYMQMLKDADKITVDTEEKKDMLEKIGKKNVTVIPDSLDWDGTQKNVYGDGKIIGWTGYGNNAKYLNDIKIPKGYTLRFVSSGDWCHHYADPDKTAQGRPWSIAMVDKYLSECDFGLYFLPDGEFEQAKGMHKLLKNWAIGLTTYTSPMPDYVKAMEEAGVGRKYIVEKASDWENLKMERNDEDIKKCREYALSYDAQTIAKLWKKEIGE